MATTNLIPTNGVHITEGEYPKGFYVAKYDRYGFTTATRFFPTIEKARAYAWTLRGPIAGSGGEIDPDSQFGVGA